ncbi:MAG: ABC transporter six-transmembrane domain-containing protein [Pseudomonadota bacterium]
MTQHVFAKINRLSLSTILRTFPGRIAITWGLTLFETVMFALLPLLIGWSIDGLLADNSGAFLLLLCALGGLLTVATLRRIFDTRAYGTIRVELGKALAERGAHKPVSVTNARILMGRELVDFLETTVPESMTAFVQIIVSVVVLLSFHSMLAISAGGAALATLLLYAAFAGAFFRINGKMNARLERQVTALESRDMRKISAHLLGLRRSEVRLSDAESLVYGLIFMALLSMLAFNLWFAVTKSGASPGQVFAIVSYSYEFIQASVALPSALQALTRLQEITRRINREAVPV